MPNIIGGLIAIVVGILGLISWWPEFGEVLRGLVPFSLIIVGLLWIASKFQQDNQDAEG
ncbi:MAG: hypothetical protein HOE48_08510 [Candidatus Latescibacteria bacterium]|nr:hypothetical protein [Candidatus Latescibacterota bacterium]MBT4137942.1 hypothetical protein [Candidatus Latescibacterota bacterium]